MTEVNPAGWFQNRTDHSANQMRMYHAGLLNKWSESSSLPLRPFGGVVYHIDEALAVTATGPATMSVNVAPGVAFVTGTEATTQGVYTCVNDAIKNLAVAASDPSLIRFDLVIARVRDAAYSGGTNAWALEVATGTPGGGVPALPANSMELARITVGAGVATITSGNINLVKKRFASALGGFQVWPSEAEVDASNVNHHMWYFDDAVDTFKYFDGSFNFDFFTEKNGTRGITAGKTYTGTATLATVSSTTFADVTNLNAGSFPTQFAGHVMWGHVRCFVQSTVANDRAQFKVTDSTAVTDYATHEVFIPVANIPFPVDFRYLARAWVSTGTKVRVNRSAGTGSVTVVGQNTTNPSWNLAEEHIENATVVP